MQRTKARFNIEPQTTELSPKLSTKQFQRLPKQAKPRSFQPDATSVSSSLHNIKLSKSKKMPKPYKQDLQFISQLTVSPFSLMTFRPQVASQNTEITNLSSSMLQNSSSIGFVKTPNYGSPRTSLVQASVFAGLLLILNPVFDYIGSFVSNLVGGNKAPTTELYAQEKGSRSLTSNFTGEKKGADEKTTSAKGTSTKAEEKKLDVIPKVSKEEADKWFVNKHARLSGNTGKRAVMEDHTGYEIIPGTDAEWFIGWGHAKIDMKGSDADILKVVGKTEYSQDAVIEYLGKKLDPETNKVLPLFVYADVGMNGFFINFPEDKGDVSKDKDHYTGIIGDRPIQTGFVYRAISELDEKNHGFVIYSDERLYYYFVKDGKWKNGVFDMSNDMQKAGIIKIENPQVGFVQGPDGTFAVVRGTNSNFMFGYSLVESTGGLIEIASR